MKVVPDVGLGPTRGKTAGRFSGLSEILDLPASEFSFPTLRAAPSCPASEPNVHRTRNFDRRLQLRWNWARKLNETRSGIVGRCNLGLRPYVGLQRRDQKNYRG